MFILEYFPFTFLSSHLPTPPQSWLAYLLLFRNTKRMQEERRTLTIAIHSWNGAIPGWKSRPWQYSYSDLFPKTNSNNSDLKVSLVIAFHHVVQHTLYNFRYLSYTLQLFLISYSNFSFSIPTTSHLKLHKLSWISSPSRLLPYRGTAPDSFKFLTDHFIIIHGSKNKI